MKYNDLPYGTVISQSFGAATVSEMNEIMRDFLIAVQLTEQGDRIYDLRIHDIANFSTSEPVTGQSYFNCVIFFSLDPFEYYAKSKTIH